MSQYQIRVQFEDKVVLVGIDCNPDRNDKTNCHYSGDDRYWEEDHEKPVRRS